jgi:hypothetical protein
MAKRIAPSKPGKGKSRPVHPSKAKVIYVWQNDAGNWYWHAIAGNARIVAIGGEPFSTRAKAAASARKFGPAGFTFEKGRPPAVPSGLLMPLPDPAAVLPTAQPAAAEPGAAAGSGEVIERGFIPDESY